MEPEDNKVGETEIVIPADEEKALDDSIAGIIDKVKAENVGDTKPPTVEVKTETPPAEVVPPVIKPEIPPENAPEAIDFTKAPVKGKFETEQSYTMRVNLFDLIKQRKEASTQPEKDAIQKQMTALRTEMGEISRRSNPSLLKPNNDDTPPDVLSDESGNKKSLTTEDVVDIVKQTQQSTENRMTIDAFFEKHAEFKDPDAKAIFIEFFDANYKLEGKNPKEVFQVLDLAHTAMFRPDETVQERVLKAAGVAEKVNAMQFPGGTIVKPGVTAEQQKSIDAIVATGKSEEYARELILD